MILWLLIILVANLLGSILTLLYVGARSEEAKEIKDGEGKGQGRTQAVNDAEHDKIVGEVNEINIRWISSLASAIFLTIVMIVVNIWMLLAWKEHAKYGEGSSGSQEPGVAQGQPVAG